MSYAEQDPTLFKLIATKWARGRPVWREMRRSPGWDWNLMRQEMTAAGYSWRGGLPQRERARPESQQKFSAAIDEVIAEVLKDLAGYTKDFVRQRGANDYAGRSVVIHIHMVESLAELLSDRRDQLLTELEMRKAEVALALEEVGCGS